MYTACVPCAQIVCIIGHKTVEQKYSLYTSTNSTFAVPMYLAGWIRSSNSSYIPNIAATAIKSNEPQTWFRRFLRNKIKSSCLYIIARRYCSMNHMGFFGGWSAIATLTSNRALFALSQCLAYTAYSLVYTHTTAQRFTHQRVQIRFVVTTLFFLSLASQSHFEFVEIKIKKKYYRNVHTIDFDEFDDDGTHNCICLLQMFLPVCLCVCSRHYHLGVRVVTSYS